MLELDEGQLSRPVLRGRGGSNTSLLPGRSVEAVASGGGFAHDLPPLGPADGGRTVASESGGSGEWRVASGGQWHKNSSQWPVASEIEEAETTVIEKRQNKANCSWC